MELEKDLVDVDLIKDLSSIKTNLDSLVEKFE